MALALASALLVAAPVGAAVAASRATATPHVVPPKDWATYHHDLLRTGDGVISGTYKSLHAKFSWKLPTPLASQQADLIFASPLVVGHAAFVTTLQNRVFAVSTSTGKTIWSRTLGRAYTQPSGTCGNIGPTIGIVSTPVIDESRGELFVVAAIGTGTGGTSQVHHLFGLAIKTGKTMLNRAIDPPGQQLQYLLQRPALALAKGRVVVGFGGNAGDCGTYHGWVESIPEVGTGAIARFEVARGTGQGRGAVWMGGGAPTVDAQGNVYVADGNGNAYSASDPYDYSDAVLKLTPKMGLLDYFAPSTWYVDNEYDSDLGSGAPQLLPNGLLLQVGKTQTGYVLNPAHLGHIDGSVRKFQVCAGLGTADGGGALVGSAVLIPCVGGLQSVTVTSGAPYGHVNWTASVAGRPPVFAAGLVWVIQGGTGSSTLFALNPATGAIALQATIGPEENHFPTPAIGDNMVVVATERALLAFPPG
jgi:outer membrane protein assembly factor BamB